MGKKVEDDVKAFIHSLNKYLLSTYYVRSTGRDTKGSVEVALRQLTLELEELSWARRWRPLNKRGHEREGTAQTGSLCLPVQKVREKGRSSQTHTS